MKPVHILIRETDAEPVLIDFPPDMLYLVIEGQTPPAPADFNRRTPRALSDVIMRLLAKKPQERYLTGAELHAALMAAVSFGRSAAWEASLFEWDEEQGTEPESSAVLRRRIRRPEGPTDSATPPAPRLVIAPALPFVRRPDRRAAMERGLERKPGSDADSARIWTTGHANPVDRFE